MIFLLLGYKKIKNIRIVSPETYGSGTWGCFSHQEDLRKERKNWYFTDWYSGGENGNETFTKTKCPVLLETTNPDEILRFIDDTFRNKKLQNDTELTELLRKALDDIETIYKDWIDIQRWTIGIAERRNQNDEE